jgi:hypothetical protein
MVNVHAFLGVQKVGLKALGVTIRCETTFVWLECRERGCAIKH